eukprot:TRINITY_DN4716_c0_g2_i7.p1 TRINITY_DN4716_c0_g2~~TRINITY_DN4716_c0_g2_i7.p1  ORF type:complete len:352 (+),score=41.72 TRINITY_DN4716_c0_g2_i7:65-1120(+)
MNIADELESLTLPKPSSTQYKRLVSRSGHLNLKRRGIGWFQLFSADIYHYYLDMSWPKLTFLSLLYWTCINLFFALLYWFDIQNIGAASRFRDAFFFSVQTMSTIGYGNYTAQSLYTNIVVFFQAWLSLITDGVVFSLIVQKLSRPSRLRHTVAFSKVAVVNDLAYTYRPQPGKLHAEEGGHYERGSPMLSFRILNLRKRQLCNPLVQLFLLRKEHGEYILHELDYECNRQTGRARAVSLSHPYLPLPWIVSHPLDKFSPLTGLSKEEMLQQECEIIVVFDVVDELTSNNFQRRWSYLPTEIRWGHKFLPMVGRDNGELEIDYSNLSVTESIDTNFVIQSGDESDSGGNGI